MRKLLPVVGSAAMAAVVSLCWVSAALADEKVEIVVVTAERRTVPLQKTAIAAAVLTAEDILKKNIQSVDALQFTTPSLSIQNFGGGDLINLRGIGKSNGGVQDPSGVVIYRDLVPSAFSGFDVDEPYYDITSIEVLRGPQGTFAGENATGGAIYVKEADPTLDNFGGWAEAQYGNFDDALVRGALNVPVTDDFGMRFAFNAEHRDSFFQITGPWTGNPGRLGSLNGRVGFLWQPTQALSVLLKVDYNYIDNGGYPQAGSPNSSTLFNFANNAHLMGLEQWVRTALTINYRFDNGITLRSISGMTYARNAWARDIGPAPTPALLGPPSIYTARAWGDVYSQELNLLSPEGQRLTWILGAYYENDYLDIPPGGFDVSLAPGGALNFLLTYKTPKSDWAVFGQGTYNITDALQLQAGLRYTQSQFHMTDTSTLSIFGFLIPYSSIKDETEKDSRLTGKIALNYNIDPDNFVYAFVATGYKQGGVNTSPSFFSPPGTLPPIFLPEYVTDYEAGWKSGFLDGHLLTQLGGFYDDYKNFQVSIEDPTQIAFIRNVLGTTTVDGFEASAQGAFGAWSFDANLAYVNSSIGTFFAVDSRSQPPPAPPGNPFPPITPCNTLTGPASVSLVNGSCVNLTGRQLSNAPPWTASAGLQYQFEFDSGDTLTPRVDYGLVGPRWTTLFYNTALGDHLIADNVFNAQLTFVHQTWQIAAFATNLFDLHYVSSAGVVLFAPGPPRQIGIRLTKSF